MLQLSGFCPKGLPTVSAKLRDEIHTHGVNDPIVVRSIGVGSIAWLPGNRPVDAAFALEKDEDLLAQARLQCLRRDRRQDAEYSIRPENAIGDQRVDVGLEGDQIAEGLYEPDERRSAIRLCGAETLCQQLPDKAT